MGKNSIGDNNENIFQNITNSQINIIENNDNLMILINSIDKFYTLVKPELINEANQILNNNFQKFKKTINNKLFKIKTDLMEETLKQPNVQFYIKDAVKNASLKGGKINLEVLSSLIIERINTTNSFLETTIESSLEVINKLSHDHYKFLAFIFIIKIFANKNHTPEIIFSMIEKCIIQSKDLPQISKNEISYLKILNLITSKNESIDVFQNNSSGNLSLSHNSYFDYIKFQNKILEKMTTKLSKEFHENFPIFKSIKSFYSKNGMSDINLTIIGTMIAFSYINEYTALDFSIENIL